MSLQPVEQEVALLLNIIYQAEQRLESLQVTASSLGLTFSRYRPCISSLRSACEASLAIFAQADTDFLETGLQKTLVAHAELESKPLHFSLFVDLVARQDDSSASLPQTHDPQLQASQHAFAPLLGEHQVAQVPPLVLSAHAALCRVVAKHVVPLACTGENPSRLCVEKLGIEEESWSTSSGPVGYAGTAT